MLLFVSEGIGVFSNVVLTVKEVQCGGGRGGGRGGGTGGGGITLVIVMALLFLLVEFNILFIFQTRHWGDCRPLLTYRGFSYLYILNV